MTILLQHIVSYLTRERTNISAVVADERKAGTPFEGHWVSNVALEEVEVILNLLVKNILKVSLWAESFTPFSTTSTQCMEHPPRWALHVTNELPLSTCDSIALIGDAIRSPLLV